MSIKTSTRQHLIGAAFTASAAFTALFFSLHVGAATPAAAQSPFATVPQPAVQATPRPSVADGEKEYRVDAARHLYAAYPMRLYRGKMPPLLYSVMVVETELDSTGQILNVSVVRKPAADEVAPWVVAMIRRAGPFPAPTRINTSSVRYLDIWLVDKSGQFQIDTLTEGQR